jgi:hypothetical protein
MPKWLACFDPRWPNLNLATAYLVFSAKFRASGLSGRLSWWDVAKYQCGLAIQDYFHRKNDFVSAKGINNAHRTYFNVGRQQRHWRA